MRVLVTGGAGFIGSHLTDALLERGDSVTVLDDLSTGRPERLPAGVPLHHGSITDRAGLTRLAEQCRPEVICHLAAQADVRNSVADATSDTGVNVVGTVNVLEAARATDARVVFASSGGALYGEVDELPSPEDVRPAPWAPYGAAKYCAEQYLALYNRLYGSTHAALRLGNVYGPRQDPTGEAGVVSIFCGCLVAGRRPTVFGDGEQTRDYIYVADVVEAFLLAVGHGGPGLWNIGTGTSTSIRKLLDLVGRTAGRVPDPRFEPPRLGELKHSALVVTRAARELRWAARTRLADGIAKVYKWVEADEPVRGER
ncbi:NAD-dependent epimerase/dehydratase family protein [Micromonospora sp. KC207]|uniref:NAD-dependent epimerase/dehydratase family protein n=1 Tax=Micromonospora sp. KC207 TaxID=2530377 RepID=UPI001047C948|nr:NAD-dependent epimerase/dehydratase family protein [Micromonospora sp. KC207]TDC67346.1 NAD-dependent epimerase/dehydratase family protein [Micromonospora sp. KC207]